MKKLILTFISFFMLFSCNKNDDENTSFTPQNITPIMISKGVLRGNGAENITQQNFVITNQIQFSKSEWVKIGGNITQ